MAEIPSDRECDAIMRVLLAAIAIVIASSCWAYSDYIVIPIYFISPETAAYALQADDVIYDTAGTPAGRGTRGYTDTSNSRDVSSRGETRRGGE